MSEVNRRWHLREHPQGDVQESDFELREAGVPTPRHGQVLVRNIYVSVDPAMRVWITGRKTYVDGVQIGQLMPAAGVGVIVESNRDDFSAGDIVTGMFGWQEYCVTDGRGLFPLTRVPGDVPLPSVLGTLGVNGLTAYFGILDVGKAEAGQTVVVSGAAGATGSIAGQIAKQINCRVVGIAGGDEKCRWLTEQANFDEAVDYKQGKLSSQLTAACPDGIDLFFDNVGGETLEAALNNLALRARIVLCGAIASYNGLATGPRNYMNLLVRRARMEGFVVMDYADRYPRALADLSRWLADDSIVDRYDIAEGIESAPRALVRLFRGANRGKQLVQVTSTL